MRAAAALFASLLPAVAGAAQVPPAATPPAAPPVIVYRCTDAAGKVSLQDAPCARGQTQQERQMLRPQDAPPAPPAAPAPPPVQAPPPAPAPPVYLAPPRPLYECVTPDGRRYTSDDGRGNPRWEPLWVLGGGLSRPGRPAAAPAQAAPPHLHAPRWPLVGGGGWVRDDCSMLPPAEACARLRDRRAELRTRFFNAQEKERDALRSEERALNARLDNDCGGR